MPVSIKGSGGGGVTLDAGAAASNTTLTLPNVSGTVLQSGTPVTVAQGGTGTTTLTANNVLLGNGTSAVQTVAPGTNGNVLTSNGTTWTSAAPSGGVTSLTAGNGITVSASTGAVTVSQDIYTGSNSQNTSFPIGTTILVQISNDINTNTSTTVYLAASSNNRAYIDVNVFSALTGTWRSRGRSFNYDPSPGYTYMYQRTA